MNTTISSTNNQYNITTHSLNNKSPFITVFTTKDAAATQIGFLQEEILKLREDMVMLENELADYDDFNNNGIN